MRRPFIMITLLAACLVTSPSWAQSPQTAGDSLQSAAASPFTLHYHGDLLAAHSAPDSAVFMLHRSTGNPNAHLTRYAQRMLGYRRVEMTRFDYALRGAGAGASMAMFAGAMANSAGIWDERTSWYVVGAASALGAIFGGTIGTPDDPKARIHISFDPSDN